MTWTSDRSGMASSGSLRTACTPPKISAIVPSRTRKRFFSEKSMMRVSIGLFFQRLRSSTNWSADLRIGAKERHQRADSEIGAPRKMRSRSHGESMLMFHRRIRPVLLAPVLLRDFSFRKISRRNHDHAALRTRIRLQRHLLGMHRTKVQHEWFRRRIRAVLLSD